MDEYFLKRRVEIVVEDMMNYTILEIRCEDLSWFWFKDSKADRAGWPIRSVIELIDQPFKITLQIRFKSQSIDSIAFAFSTSKICLMKLIIRKLMFTDATSVVIVVIGLIIVVDIAIVHIDVVGVARIGRSRLM